MVSFVRFPRRVFLGCLIAFSVSQMSLMAIEEAGTNSVRRPPQPYASVHIRDAAAWREAFATSATARWWSHPKLQAHFHAQTRKYLLDRVLFPEGAVHWVTANVNEWWANYDLGSAVGDAGHNRDWSYVLQAPNNASISDLAAVCGLQQQENSFIFEDVGESRQVRLHDDGSQQWLLEEFSFWDDDAWDDDAGEMKLQALPAMPAPLPAIGLIPRSSQAPRGLVTVDYLWSGLDPLIDPQLAEEARADFQLFSETMADSAYDLALAEVRFEAAYSPVPDGIIGECLVHIPAAWLQARQPFPTVDFNELANLPDTTVAVLDIAFDPSAEERRLQLPGGQYWWLNMFWFFGLDSENEMFIKQINGLWRTLSGPGRVLLATDTNGTLTVTVNAELSAGSSQDLHAYMNQMTKQLPAMIQQTAAEGWRIITPFGVQLFVTAEGDRWALTSDQRGTNWLHNYHGSRLGDAADFQADVATVPNACRAFLFVRSAAYIDASAKLVDVLLPVAGGQINAEQAAEGIAVAREVFGTSRWVGWIANDPVGYRIGGHGPFGDPSLWLFAADLSNYFTDASW